MKQLTKTALSPQSSIYSINCSQWLGRCLNFTFENWFFFFSCTVDNFLSWTRIPSMCHLRHNPGAATPWIWNIVLSWWTTGPQTILRGHTACVPASTLKRSDCHPNMQKTNIPHVPGKLLRHLLNKNVPSNIHRCHYTYKRPSSIHSLHHMNVYWIAFLRSHL